MADSLKELFSEKTKPLPDELSPVLNRPVYVFRDRLNRVIGQIRERAPESIRNIYVDLVDDFSFNAMAFIVDKHEFVGINAGCALLLPLFFNFVLSQPQAFPEIGNPANEKPTYSSFVQDLLSISGRAHDFELSALQLKTAVTQDRVRHAVTADWGWPDICRAWSRAIMLLYSLMAIRAGAQSVFSKGTHPHPIVRFNAIANEAWDKWQVRIPESSTYQSIVYSVRDEINNMGRDKILPLSIPDSAAPFQSDIAKASDELWNELNRIAPVLNELTARRIAWPN